MLTNADKQRLVRTINQAIRDGERISAMSRFNPLRVRIKKAVWLKPFIQVEPIYGGPAFFSKYFYRGPVCFYE
jgi:hypothetical protein